MDLFLASASPRRKELLAQIGLRYTTVLSLYEEGMGSVPDPIHIVERNALGKARGAFPLPGPGICVGADTIVVLDGVIMGKPVSHSRAVEMLGALSGREHEVITGLALVDHTGRAVVAHEVTRVRFRVLKQAEIESYVDTGEPHDKAGAYAIQGLAAVFIAGITGCYSNVVGLPLSLLTRLLDKHWSVRIDDIWRVRRNVDS
jgi:septum formation protein